MAGLPVTVERMVPAVEIDAIFWVTFGTETKLGNIALKIIFNGYFMPGSQIFFFFLNKNFYFNFALRKIVF